MALTLIRAEQMQKIKHSKLYTMKEIISQID